jgi:hypothetical protein
MTVPTSAGLYGVLYAVRNSYVCTSYMTVENEREDRPSTLCQQVPSPKDLRQVATITHTYILLHEQRSSEVAASAPPPRHG